MSGPIHLATSGRIEAGTTDRRQTNDVESADSPVPIAVPIAASHPSPSGQLTATSVPPLEGTDAAQPRSTPARQAAGRLDLEALRGELGAPGWNTLELIEQHRFLSTPQLTRLYFAGRHTPDSAPVAAGRVTRWLKRHRLIDRLERRIGGMRAGSSGMVWFLTERGHRLLHPDAQRRSRPHEPSTTFLTHTLAIGDVHVHLVDAARAGQLELVTLVTEPQAWRRFLTPAGVVQPLKPDLYAELAIPPGDEDLLSVFIEVDLGSEHLPTLLRKCRTYADYARSGHAERDGGMPLVIWQMSARTPGIAQRRRQHLADGIAKDPRLDARMFRITTPESLITTLCAEAGQEGDAL